MDDAQVQQQLADVLAEYDVSVEVSHIRQNAIEFWLNNKRIVHQFDPQGDIAAGLRETLQGLGARSKIRSDEPVETVIEKPMAAEIPMPEEVTDPPEPTPTTRIYSDHGVTKVYQSARVIAIELDHDLIIPKGHMLVIPLNRPNTLIDMLKEQFEVLFEKTDVDAADEIDPSLAIGVPDVVPAAKATPRPPPPPPRPPPPPPPLGRGPGRPPINFENDILDYLKQRRGAVKAKVIASAVRKPVYRTEAHLRTLQARGIVECPQTGFWALVKRTGAVKKADPVEPLDPVAKVPPQIMRILTAMAYASKVNNQPDLTTQDVIQYLNSRDARQYGARMPSAIDKGLVERGKPLDESRGFHHRLTPQGFAVVKEQGALAYESDELEVPEWLAEVQ